MPKETMKETMIVSVFLVFVFVMTVMAHLLYVEGYAFNVGGGQDGHAEELQSMSIYKTQAECEHDSGVKCILQVCDDIPAGKDFEDLCGQGFKKGWQPQMDKAPAHGAGGHESSHEGGH